MKILGHVRTGSLAYPGEERELIRVDFDDANAHDKIATLRTMIAASADDPIIGELAARIVSGVPARDYMGQAAALLAFTQQSVKYIDDGTQTFRMAKYTLAKGYGNCGNVSIVFGALCESIAIPVRLIVLEHRTGLFGLRRDPFHVYPAVALPPSNPQVLVPAEPTLPVPLGWDPSVYAEDHSDEL